MYSALIRTRLSHVQFETVHPCIGRVGRILNEPLLYLVCMSKKSKRLLDAVRHHAWLRFILEGITETSENAVSVGLSRLECAFS